VKSLGELALVELESRALPKWFAKVGKLVGLAKVGERAELMGPGFDESNEVE